MPAPARSLPRPRTGPRGSRPRGTRFRWGLWLTGVCAVLILTVGGTGQSLVGGLMGEVKRVDPFLGLAGRPERAHGKNFLVVGLDDREGISARQRHAYRLGGSPCDCTDTLMLVHLSADRDRMSVVSIPRDSYVRLPGHRHRSDGTYHRASHAKINAAYAHGGAALTVRTVEAMTGVHIDHYLEVDFSSFMRTVDALGGVAVCTTKPLRDSYAGLDLPAGTSQLNGAEALAYVRARHVDGEADFGRMRRQQRLLAALVEKATGGGVLTNPRKFREVVSGLLGSVRTDREFGTAEVLALGTAMRGFSTSSSEFVQVPVANASHLVPGLGSTVRWNGPRAARLFRALSEDRPLAPQRVGPEGASDRRAGQPHGAPVSRTAGVREAAAPVAGAPADGLAEAEDFSVVSGAEVRCP